MVSDVVYADTNAPGNQLVYTHPNDVFTVTLQATPANAARVSHFIKLRSFALSPDHDERSSASLLFDWHSTSTSIWVTHTWRDASGAERIDKWELPLP